jgi:hypothetical protein
MTFFRVVLCLGGLLLYLVVREFSSNDAASPPVQNVLQPVPPMSGQTVIPLEPASWSGHVEAVHRPFPEVK